MTAVAKQLVQTGSFHDPARGLLLETRKTVVGGWLQIADKLDLQGEIILAANVRYFARHLPPIITDNEALTVELAQHLRPRHTEPTDRLNYRAGRETLDRNQRAYPARDRAR